MPRNQYPMTLSHPLMAGLSATEQETVLGVLAKSLSGEDGYLTMGGRRIQKDATGNIGVTTGLGLLGLPLEAPAKLLYPVPTLLRNRLPRPVVGGSSTTFRKIKAINKNKIWGSVAEASDSTTGRNSRIAFDEADTTYNFKSIEMETMLTPEALFGSNSQITPGQDFDARGFASLSLLQSTQLAEEDILLGGNPTALGDVAGMANAATQPAAATGTLAVSTAHYVFITAFTLQGYRLSAQGQGTVTASTDVAGETTQATSFTTTTAGSGAGSDARKVTWTAKRGAVGYNVYVSTTNTIASAKYFATVYVNECTITSLPGSGNRPNAVDQTGNSLDFTGLIQFCENTDAGYYNSLNGAALTADGSSSVTEIDTLFRTMYTLYKTGPSELFVNVAEKYKIDKLVAGSTAPTLRIDAQAGDLSITGTVGVKDLMNRYTGQKVPVTVHPTLPPGTILAPCFNLGPFYAGANVGQNVDMPLSWDYRLLPFAMAKRAEEWGMDLRGCMRVYANFAMGSITNVG